MYDHLLSRRDEERTRINDLNKRRAKIYETVFHEKCAMGLGALIFIGNIYGTIGPDLSGIALIAVIGGAVSAFGRRTELAHNFDSIRTAEAALIELNNRIRIAAKDTPVT
jgi:hypothetical protein